MSDNNQVDGIKKLDEEERKKSREIVLETIGENDSSSPSVKAGSGKINKRLDGILGFGFGKKKGIAESVMTKPTIKQEQKAVWQKEINKIIPAATEADKTGVQTITPAKTPNFLADIKVHPKTEARVIMPPLQPIKKELPAAIRKNKIEKTKEGMPKKAAGKEKKAVTKLRKFPATKLGLQAKKTAARQLRLQGIFSFNQSWQELSKHFEIRLNIAVRKSLRWLGAFLVITTIIYTLLTLVIIKTGADNLVLRQVAKYIIIPALITPDGLIDFYQYQDIKNENNNSADTKTAIIKHLLVNNLCRRLRLSSDKCADNLARAIISDEEINKAPLERIRKIRDLIKQNNDFAVIAAKYGDESVQLILTADNRNQYNFSEQITNLNDGAISEIIYGTDGYYIFQGVNKNDSEQQINYVKIRSKSLNTYLNETAADYKIISFVN